VDGIFMAGSSELLLDSGVLHKFIHLDFAETSLFVGLGLHTDPVALNGLIFISKSSGVVVGVGSSS
jgi:hypothetical protein